MKRVTVLTGGVGGAKLVLGLDTCSADLGVTAIVNTGDDFKHLGLHVSPDIDTLLYTLSGQSNSQLGWGREGETWNFMQALRRLGGEDWFNLGDGDLAVHVLRSQQLSQGRSLTGITAGMVRAWKIGTKVLPMSDAAVRTIVSTDEGDLPFQTYFVARKCEPAVTAIGFDGAADAAPAPGVIDAIVRADAVIIAPSNPFLSVAPLLAVPAIAEALDRTRAPIVAVSPIICGKAVKGPTAKIMGELGLAVTNEAILAYYGDLLDGMVIDGGDDVPTSDVVIGQTATLMTKLDDKQRVARAALDLAEAITQR